MDKQIQENPVNNPDETSDELLWDQFCEGKTTAFFTLQERYSTVLFDYFLALVGNKASAARLLGRLWVDAYFYAGGIDKFSNFRTWLFALATAVYDDPARLEAMGLMAIFDPRMTNQLDSLPDNIPHEAASLPKHLKLPLLLVSRYEFDLDETAQICRANARKIRARLHKALEFFSRS